MTCTVKASWATNDYYLATSLEQSTTAPLLGTTTTITSTVPETNPLKVTVYFTVTERNERSDGRCNRNRRTRRANLHGHGYRRQVRVGFHDYGVNDTGRDLRGQHR